MTPRLSPYPAYKDSGVPWLGDVPEHWDVGRLRSALVRNDSGCWGSDFSASGSLVLRSNEQTVDGTWQIVAPARRLLSHKEQSESRLVEGDLVITKSSGSSKHIGKTSLVTPEIAAMECCFSNFMQRIRLDATVEPKLAWYWLNSQVGRGQLVYESNTTTGLANLNGVIIGNLSFGFPPLSEQVAIVRYLDHADRKVRRAIRMRQQLIKLLTEQKQAIIQRAVTRGLDPNVRLKPSGVPWLGDVPEHWEIRKVKYVLQTDGYRAGPFGSALITSQLNPSGTIGVLSPEHVARASMNLDIDLFLPETREREMSQFLVKGRDILFPIVGTLGRAMVVPRDVGKAIINQRLARLRPDETRINSDYLALLMSKVTLYQELDRVECKGSILDHITKERILERPLPLPPLGEQRAILQFVNAATASLDKAIDVAHREIDLLREYRTRLIADVVTGKLDVRNVPVPSDETDVLPEELESIDDADTVDQSDDAIEENSKSSAEESA